MGYPGAHPRVDPCGQGRLLADSLNAKLFPVLTDELNPDLVEFGHLDRARGSEHNSGDGLAELLGRNRASGSRGERGGLTTGVDDGLCV